MAKGYNVLFVTSEVLPYSKTGGLADVSNSLPQALNSLSNEVRIITPKYGQLDERRLQIHEIKRLKDINLEMAGKKYKYSIKSSFIHGKNTKAQIYLLENQDFFKNKGIYQNIKTKKDFPNNDERYMFFCKAVLEVLEILQWKPDIIHCNDWQTGLIPFFIKTMYKNNPHISDIKTVFTIHNLAYQGNFPKTTFKKTELPDELFNDNTVKFHDKFSFLKAGIKFADKVTTVSQKYAEEIRTNKEYSCGMEDVLNDRRKDLVGILNGIDNTVWNPSFDKVIDYRYTYQEIPLKYENKRELLEKHKLVYNENIPLIGIISRLVDQKGFDLILDAFDDIMKEKLQMIILGTGDEKYQKFLMKMKKKYNDKLIIHLGFDEDLAHKIEAGSDMYLMPSKFEPCGLNQMYSLKYGTVPIVRNTGGLSDTVTNYKDPKKGNGFLFDKYDSKEMVKTIRTALEVYQDKKTWYNIMKNGMALDFSWNISAKKYMELFKQICNKK
ncbi:MAG TPA: glycogen synthase GlgA [Ignavibacteria bacterium]|nr:glycogen synthase GlgA [Ignavibacteria bacterium]